jgi:membrane associated rhomboid family serine protease
MGFSDESGSRQPFLRAPMVVIGLILVLVCAHLARIYAFPTASTAWIYNYGFWPARYSHTYLAARGGNPGSLLDRALPFVTYIFLHANFTHLLLNCVWLLAFGPVVARRFGAPLFLVFFLLCGIAGAVVHLALNWGGEAPVIGASAAVSGLMGASFRMIGISSSDRHLEPILSPRILLWTAIWVLLNVLAGLTGFGAGRFELVAWQAHLGGYAAGLLLARPFNSLGRRQAAAGLPT